VHLGGLVVIAAPSGIELDGNHLATRIRVQRPGAQSGFAATDVAGCLAVSTGAF
jgi:hypothetical protein